MTGFHNPDVIKEMFIAKWWEVFIQGCKSLQIFKTTFNNFNLDQNFHSMLFRSREMVVVAHKKPPPSYFSPSKILASQKSEDGNCLPECFHLTLELMCFIWEAD